MARNSPLAAVWRHIEYSMWRTGSILTARALPQLPSRGAQLQMPGVATWRSALTWWGFTLFWNAIIGGFFWVFWITPVILRDLVRRGAPTIGRICDKKIQSGEDSDSHILHYEYAPVEYSNYGPKSQGDAFAPIAATTILQTPLKGKMTVKKEEYENAKVGDAMTILFDANSPKRSLIYRFADWEILA